MRKFSLPWQKVCCVIMLLCSAKITKSQIAPQTLKLQNFAIWAGSAPTSPYNSSQGVIFNNSAVIQGNIGSNHLINVKNNLTLTGNIYSGNLISFTNNAKITGDIFANRSGTSLNPTIAFGSRDTIIGNL